MSVYVTGGTFGLACGPLIGVAVFSLLGSRGTAVLLLPVVAIAAFLLTSMRARDEARRPPGAAPPSPKVAVPRGKLLATVGMMMSRSWTVVTLQAFTPTWYHQLGYRPWFYGPLATTLVLASAAGAIGCGGLADRYGRRTVILVTLVLSVPAVAAYVAFPGPAGFAWAILVGLLAASTAPLTLMLAQELMAGRAGLASGLIMGLGFSAGAIGVPVTGMVADHLGLQVALALQVLVVLATIPLALLLPTEGFLRRLRQEFPRPASPPAVTELETARMVPLPPRGGGQGGGRPGTAHR